MLTLGLKASLFYTFGGAALTSVDTPDGHTGVGAPTSGQKRICPGNFDGRSSFNARRFAAGNDDYMWLAALVPPQLS